MKVKFYTLALLASMAFGATAAETLPMKLADGCKLTKVVNPLLKYSEDTSKNTMKVPATGKDITGDYVAIYSNLVGDDEVAPRNVDADAFIDEGDNENEYIISFPFAMGNELYAVDIPFTVSGNTLTMTPTTLSLGEPVPLILCTYNPYATNSSDVLTEVDKIEVEFNGTGFIFPEQYAFGAGDFNTGFYFIANKLSVQKVDVPDSEMNLGWTSLGMATFQDGWILPGLSGGEQVDPEYWYEVELQQSENDENVYRLVNPYGPGCFFAEYNQYADRNGFIQFNVKDPDHVYFDVVPANFCNSEVGITQVYAMNTFSMLLGYYGWDFDGAIEEYGSQLIWTTFKDGVVTVPSVLDSKGQYNNDAMFGMEGYAFGGFSWGTDVSMEAKIFFPEAGVEGIFDNSNAPVKYYNLQGVEIANPEKGQLVIKKQGSKAEKLIVR